MAAPGGPGRADAGDSDKGGREGSCPAPSAAARVRQLDLQGNCPCFKPGLGPRPARCSRLLIFFGGTFFSLRFPAEKAHPLPWVYLG